MRRFLAAASVLAVAGPISAFAQNAEAPADGAKWRAIGEAALAERLERRDNHRRAKNVIVFIADGMGPSLVSASRIYEGQLRGEEGEENFLSFERFPYSGLVKTYSTDEQVPDSAATASAIMTGVKTHSGGVSVYSGQRNCLDVPENMATFARRAGRSVGVVTTTYVVDATPASVYAHAPSRRWGTPDRMPSDAEGCTSISDQMIAADLDVAMGGGRTVFLPDTATDFEEDEQGGRLDGLHLIDQWSAGPGRRNFVWSAEQLAEVDLSSTDKLLGLFAYGSMVFEEETDDGSSNPSLSDMTAAAIDVLSANRDGYFLMVEHEGSDDLQHGGLAKQAMESVIELAEAVETALEKTDARETLVIVTSDHSQTFTFSGGQDKGNPILGLVRSDGELTLAGDGKPFTTIGFSAGPGAWEGERPDLTDVDTTADDFRQQAMLPTRGVPHSGSDVAVYATGPWADLFTGVVEQNALGHFIRHAMEPRRRN